MQTGNAQHLIDTLGLAPHPEGGHYRRIHASTLEVECNGLRRPAMTAIHYLLASGERSQWHRVDADEAWQWLQGGALVLSQYDDAARACTRTVLGPAAEGHRPASIVPAGVWQSARPLGDHALVSCLVAPGFAWEGFALPDPDSDLARELLRFDALHR